MSNWRGKVIGAALGWMLAGPVGFLLGLWIGNLFDRGLSNILKGGASAPRMNAEAQQVFFEATFSVMGHIAKADGRVSEGEINAARATMQKLNLTEAEKQKAIEYFNQGKRSDFNFIGVLTHLKQQCGRQRALMQLFVEAQMQAALADGSLSAAKRALLKQLCEVLGFASSWALFEHFFQGAQYSQQQSWSGGQQGHQQYYQAPRSQGVSLSDAYALLGVTAKATDAEIKRAYRRLMSQNHPDKLVSKGLPEHMMKLATEKTQKIQAAYEVICKSRGI